MAVTRRTRKEVLKQGLGRLQKLLAALPAQQRLDSLQYFSETLRSSLLRHMELQHIQRSFRKGVTPPRSLVPPKEKKVVPTRGISMIKTKDGHVRYMARAIISGIAISSRCVHSREEAEELRKQLDEVSRHKMAADSTGQWLKLAFDKSQAAPHAWHFRATVDARRFLGRTLSSRQVTEIAQALALKQDLEKARQQGWHVLRASWVQSMQEPRGGRFGHRALSFQEADAMCKAAEEKAETCARVRSARCPRVTPLQMELRAQRGLLARQKQLQHLVSRLEKTLKALQLSGS